MEIQSPDKKKSIIKLNGAGGFQLLPGYVVKILLLLPLVLALIPAALVAGPIWVMEGLQRKKDCIR